MPIDKSHFILFVRDQAASAAFYRQVLRAEPTLDVPGMTAFELGPGCVLGLMPASGIARILSGAVDPAEAGHQPRSELYLEVPDPSAWQARAAGAGGRALGPPAARAWGHLVAYCRDPDGHLIAFAKPLDAPGIPSR